MAEKTKAPDKYTPPPFEVMQLTIVAAVVVRNAEGEVAEVREAKLPLLQKDFDTNIKTLIPKFCEFVQAQLSQNERST